MGYNWEFLMNHNQNGQTGKTLMDRLLDAAERARRHQGKSSLACPIQRDIPIGATALGTLSIRHQYLFQAMKEASKDAEEALKRAEAAKEHFDQVHAAVFESIRKEHQGSDFPNLGIAANWQVFGDDSSIHAEMRDTMTEFFRSMPGGEEVVDLLERMSGRRARHVA